MNLRTLSHEEFLRYADSQANSELEIEMLRRLQAPGFDQDMLDAMQDGTLDAQKVRELMYVLDEYDIETPEELRATLDQGFAYVEVARDHGIESSNALADLLERNTSQPEQKEA